MTRFTIRYLDRSGLQDGSWYTLFGVSQAQEPLLDVRVLVDREMRFFAGQHLGLDDPWTCHEDERFTRGVLRLTTRRVEDALKAEAFALQEGEDVFAIDLNGGEEDTVALVREMMLGDKECSYQVLDTGNLFCSAAAPNDETALGIVLNNGRRVAPTSRPLCARCSLPDTDYMCSHFLHPQVFGIRAMGGPRGFVSRDVMDGMCDLDRPEFAHHKQCHAGGNTCWERQVDVETAPPTDVVPPQAIEQALDDLDVRWRLAFENRHLVRLPGAADVSILALPCGTRDEFERRLSVLADIIKRLDIPDELLPSGTELPETSHTLRRLELLFEARELEDSLGQVRTAISTLRNVNSLRAGGQHGGEAAKRRAKAADALGVPLDGRWGEAWERVRALAASAIRDIGRAVQGIADQASRNGA
jgi:hypothetical protein